MENVMCIYFKDSIIWTEGMFSLWPDKWEYSVHETFYILNQDNT